MVARGVTKQLPTPARARDPSRGARAATGSASRTASGMPTERRMPATQQSGSVVGTVPSTKYSSTVVSMHSFPSA